MDREPPFVRLPDELTFSLHEVADVLFAVDLAVARTVPGGAEQAAARRVQRLLTSRLWGELGQILDDGEEGDG